MKALSAVLPVLLLFTFPFSISAEQWRFLGPDSATWNSGLLFSQGDSLFACNPVGRSADTFYIFAPLTGANRGIVLVPKLFLNSFDRLSNIQAGATTWFTMQQGNSFLYRMDTNEHRWKNIQILDLAIRNGCIVSNTFGVLDNTVAVGVSGYHFTSLPCADSYFGLYVSEDNGVSWKSFVSDWNPNIRMGSLIITPKNVVASTSLGTVLFNRTTGDTLVLPAPQVFQQLYECGTQVYGVASTNGRYQNAPYVSIDSCRTWRACGIGLPDSIAITSICATGTTVYLSSNRHGLFTLDNAEGLWKPCNDLPEAKVYSLCNTGKALFAITEHGVYVESSNTHMARRRTSVSKRIVLRKYTTVQNHHVLVTDGKKNVFNLSGKKIQRSPNRF